MFEGPDDRWYASRRDYEIISMRTRVVQEGWVTLEGFSRYAISVDGCIINRQRMRPVTTRYHTGGRPIVSLVADDTGRQTTLSIARLVALAYLPAPPPDGQYYDVEYKDGDPTNNHASNLMWKARWRNHTGQ